MSKNIVSLGCNLIVIGLYKKIMSTYIKMLNHVVLNVFPLLLPSICIGFTICKKQEKSFITIKFISFSILTCFTFQFPIILYVWEILLIVQIFDFRFLVDVHILGSGESEKKNRNLHGVRVFVCQYVSQFVRQFVSLWSLLVCLSFEQNVVKKLRSGFKITLMLLAIVLLFLKVLL